MNITTDLKKVKDLTIAGKVRKGMGEGR